MRYLRSLTTVKTDFDDVKSVGDIASEQAQPVGGTVPQKTAFFRIDGSTGRTVVCASSCFYLSEYKCVAFTTH